MVRKEGISDCPAQVLIPSDSQFLGSSSSILSTNLISLFHLPSANLILSPSTCSSTTSSAEPVWKAPSSGIWIKHHFLWFQIQYTLGWARSACVVSSRSSSSRRILICS